MNYGLPTSVTVADIDYEIRSDYRAILDIIEAMMSDDFSDSDKVIAIMNVFYVNIPPEEVWEEALRQAFDFIAVGHNEAEDKKAPRLVSWTQDFNHIISAINNVAGQEVRAVPYCHWWTFIGYYDSIDGESTFANIVAIRHKKAKGKKLEKWEQEWYIENKSLVDFKKTIVLSNEEQQLLKSLRGE
jgi:hypothetical protein